jgi:hypothetical protein
VHTQPALHCIFNHFAQRNHRAPRRSRITIMRARLSRCPNAPFKPRRLHEPVGRGVVLLKVIRPICKFFRKTFSVTAREPSRSLIISHDADRLQHHCRAINSQATCLLQFHVHKTRLPPQQLLLVPFERHAHSITLCSCQANTRPGNRRCSVQIAQHRACH